MSAWTEVGDVATPRTRMTSALVSARSGSTVQPLVACLVRVRSGRDILLSVAYISPNFIQSKTYLDFDIL